MDLLSPARFWNEAFDRPQSVGVGLSQHNERKSMSKKTMPVWDLVATVIEHSRTTLLYGPPGTGKSFSAHTADLCGRDLYTITLTPDTPAAELRGHYVPRGNAFVWQDGPAIKAWREGGRLVINEIDHAGGDALSFLLNCLDSPETAALTLPTGELVRPHRQFQAVATMNGKPDEDLLPALRDRFPVCIEINEAHPQGLASLPQDLQLAAKGTVVASDPSRRVTLRAWRAFASLRNRIGADAAAVAAFQSRGKDILDALRIAQAG
jgi:MoxR-like ATPase